MIVGYHLSFIIIAVEEEFFLWPRLFKNSCTMKTFHFPLSYHCRLVYRALAGVAVARALPADGDVPEAVEVLSQGQLVQEVVGSGLRNMRNIRFPRISVKRATGMHTRALRA